VLKFGWIIIHYLYRIFRGICDSWLLKYIDIKMKVCLETSYMRWSLSVKSIVWTCWHNKDKLVRRDSQLSDLVSYIRATQPGQLHGYHGKDVELILRLLRSNSSNANQSTASSSTSDIGTADTGSGSGGGGESTHSYGERSTRPAVQIPDNGDARNYNIVDWHFIEHGEYDVLHEVAHGLHFASIAMLGFLVVEVWYTYIGLQCAAWSLYCSFLLTWNCWKLN